MTGRYKTIVVAFLMKRISMMPEKNRSVWAQVVIEIRRFKSLSKRDAPESSIMLHSRVRYFLSILAKEQLVS